MFKKVVIPSRNDIDGAYITICMKNGDNVFNFYIDSVPHCCGLLEIGSMTISYYADNFDFTNQKHVDALIKKLAQLLGQLCKRATSVSKRENGNIVVKKYQLMCNLVDSEPCNILREAMHLSGKFYKVTDFININSNNRIEVWFSK